MGLTSPFTIELTEAEREALERLTDSRARAVRAGSAGLGDPGTGRGDVECRRRLRGRAACRHHPLLAQAVRR